ncbi:MAG: hypothetical protein ACNA8W_07525, partial [Bradymonadaceae bacterium]
QVSVWIRNAGAVRVGANISVSFYAVDGNTRHFLGETQTQQALEPGQSERVEAMLEVVPAGGPYDIIAVADDVNGTGEGTRNECNTDNNTLILDTGFICQ